MSNDDPHSIKVSEAEYLRLMDLIENPAPPTARLLAAAKVMDERWRGVGTQVLELSPDDLTRHEVLHVARLLEDMIERHLCQHPAIVSNVVWADLARRAAMAVAELHNAIAHENQRRSASADRGA